MHARRLADPRGIGGELVEEKAGVVGEALGVGAAGGRRAVGGTHGVSPRAKAAAFALAKHYAIVSLGGHASRRIPQTRRSRGPDVVFSCAARARGARP